MCNHPNIIKIYACFEDEEHIYIIMELASDKTLYTLLRKDKKFSEKIVKKYIRDVLRAFKYLHSFDPPILHRDLKPENLLM